jgi:hypothetical protein
MGAVIQDGRSAPVNVVVFRGPARLKTDIAFVVGRGRAAGLSLWRRRFADKDQMFGIEIRLGIEPRMTPRRDVGSCLLARVRRFLNVIL